MRPRRNLLFILAHGLRSDALSDEREWPLPTPHLVDLATRGVRLVASSTSPTDPAGMASLITGLHARQLGGHRTLADQTLHDGLPNRLREAGYHTVGVGEVSAFSRQLDESVVTQGAVLEPDPGACWYAASADARGHGQAIVAQRRQRLRTGPIAPDRLLLEPEEDIDGFITTQAIEAMERLPDDKPWAMFVVYSGPGNDLPPPLYFDDLVPSETLGRDFAPADLGMIDHLIDPELPRAILQRLEPYQIGRVRSDYLGRVSLIDHGVGQLGEAVAGRSDSNHVWTMLCSDRGRLLGEHGLLGHRTFLAGAIEVPLIVTPPRGGRCPSEKFQDGMFSTLDFTATAAALGGVDLPESCSGRSVLPIFHGEPVLPSTRANLSEFGDRTLVETERYKAVFRQPDARCISLHDMLTDPDEKQDLSKSEKGGDIARAMRSTLGQLLLPLRAV